MRFWHLWQIVTQIVDPIIHRGKQERALRIASAFSRLRPRDPESWLLHQRVHCSFGQEPQAEEVLRKGLRRLPNDKRLLVALADVLTRQKRFEEAKDTLNDVKNRNPDFALAYVGLADVAKWERDYEQVRMLAKEAEIRITDPESLYDNEALGQLGSVLLAVPGEQAWAEKLFTRAADVGWRDSRPHMVLALLTQRRGDADSAREHYDLARRYWRGPDESFRDEMEWLKASLAELEK